MRVAVNLNMFHPELPLLQRYKAAAAAGFRQVEVSVPYSEKAEDLKSTADSLGLSHTLINAPPGIVCKYLVVLCKFLPTQSGVYSTVSSGACPSGSCPGMSGLAVIYRFGSFRYPNHYLGLYPRIMVRIR
ncbi:hypothetical protein Y032_0018g3602 [Ancylostoma ceylanicum]|uniref:Hydroxypyruvate isomerase n=1 Tax=Ancylostoma ceylanicum TaxID=53326 RepID=A0A016V4G4_9BILA|nr:hypothetical protein Y032_0018g3602 [Ancylostoma ceylanicum]